MTATSARERSSSACVSTSDSLARSACAARTPKVASRPALPFSGSTPLSKTSWRTPSGGSPSRTLATDLPTATGALLSSISAATCSSSASCASSTATSAASSSGPPSLRRHSKAPDAPPASTASCTSCAALPPVASASASPASSSSRSRRPPEPSMPTPSSVARTRPACAAADSANDLSSFPNGSAARTSSSSPTTSSPRSIGTYERRFGPANRARAVPRADELGRERTRGSPDRPSDQIAAPVLTNAHDRGVRAQRRPDRFGQGLERVRRLAHRLQVWITT